MRLSSLPRTIFHDGKIYGLEAKYCPGMIYASYVHRHFKDVTVLVDAHDRWQNSESECASILSKKIKVYTQK